MELFNFQKEAVDRILRHIDFKLDPIEPSDLLVFESPTGTGKTFMMSKVMENMILKNNNVSFIWTTVGKGDLHVQSYNSVTKYIGNTATTRILDESNIQSSPIIDTGEVLFINWEKITSKNPEDEWINTLMKDQEKVNFIDMIQNTKKQDRKIILVVDESHIGKGEDTRISEIKKDVIDPDLTMEMSATPQTSADVKVDIQRAIDEGLIKKGLYVNEGITITSVVGKTTSGIILDKGYDKLLDLRQEYENIGSPVKPLLLVQVSNGRRGDEQTDEAIEYFKSKGITIENGKLKVWMTGPKGTDFDKEEIKKFNDPTEVLIFKVAIATGWDCPRAQILIKFRDGSKSETFEIQTIGRITRAAEAKSYNNDKLDYAYIYSNADNFDLSQDNYYANRVYLDKAILRQDVDLSNVKLISYYRSRSGNYNDITADFHEIYDKKFNAYFDSRSNTPLKEFIKRMHSKGFEFDYTKKIQRSILEEDTKEYADLYNQSNRVDSTVKINLSNREIYNAVEKLIKDNLGGLSFSRSKGVVETAIKTNIMNKLEESLGRADSTVSIYKLILLNKTIIEDILRLAIDEYKETRKTSKSSGVNYEYKFELEKLYTENTHKEIMNTSKSIYTPLLLPMSNKEVNKLELSFIQYLENHVDVEWYLKNDDSHSKRNFGIPYNKTSTFQPDFIVKFKNGTIGIFDTKGDGYLEDTSHKYKGLHTYLKDRKELVGGMVISDKPGEFKIIHDSAKYVGYKTNPKNWTNMNDFIENFK